MQGITLSEEQGTAFELCQKSNKRLFILTGKPGTGKTTLAFWIVDHFMSLGQSVALCAPTGRAAKRLSDKTGHPASTIHRLLEYNPAFGWNYNKSNPLPFDVVVVDESSMIDMFLFYRLVSALKKSSRLILCGDPYQLPPVGPGMPFKDLINSGEVPTYELQQIHRQAQDNHIVLAAHAILNGDSSSVSWDGERTDFQLISHNAANYDSSIMSEDSGEEIEKDEEAKKLFEAIQDQLLKLSYSLKQPFTNIQVLCPQKKGAVGTKSLNGKFQTLINPPTYKSVETKSLDYTFREGDRVIQLKNDYQIGIFNGDIGVVTKIFSQSDPPPRGTPRETIMVVDFEGYQTPSNIPSSKLNNIALAYALTIHKSQGSEYPVVLIPCHRSNIWMWTRPLLYTAVTRAKGNCVLFGDLSMISKAIRDNREDKRKTYLKERINLSCNK